jgi:hypothetical protein
MSSPEAATGTTGTTGPAVADDTARILAAVDGLLATGRIGDVPDAAAQQLLLAAVRLFAAKRAEGDRLPAFGPGLVTATEVAVTAVALTEAVNLELFELALWNGWSNV